MIYFLVLKVLIWEVARMKYFLRKSKLKRGEYLQIYKSEYIRGVGSRNTSYKAVGYVCDLKEKGVKDPVAKAQAEVKRLNDALREQEAGERARKIGTLSPERHLGYFALKGVANSLTFFEKAIRAISSVRSFQYDVYDMMMALVYARATYPSSKKRTHEDILPQLFEDVGGDSYHQVLSCCEFLGQEYKNPIQREAFLKDNCDACEQKGYMKPYSPEELQGHKERHTNLSIEIDKIEDEKKVAMETFKGQLKPLREECKQLLKNIKAKAEYVTETCYRFTDQETKETGYYNKDGKLIESRPATADELQPTIFGVVRNLNPKTGTDN